MIVSMNINLNFQKVCAFISSVINACVQNINYIKNILLILNGLKITFKGNYAVKLIFLLYRIIQLKYVRQNFKTSTIEDKM